MNDWEGEAKEGSCLVMCMVESYDEFVTLLSDSRPVARKEHRCNECGRTIQRGEKYLVENYVFEHEKSTHKTCSHCQQVREWLLTECNGFIYHCVAEDIIEHAREGYGVGVCRMAVGIRNKWQRKNGQLMPIPKMPPTSDSRMRLQGYI